MLYTHAKCSADSYRPCMADMSRRKISKPPMHRPPVVWRIGFRNTRFVLQSSPHCVGGMHIRHRNRFNSRTRATSLFHAAQFFAIAPRAHRPVLREPPTRRPLRRRVLRERASSTPTSASRTRLSSGEVQYHLARQTVLQAQLVKGHAPLFDLQSAVSEKHSYFVCVWGVRTIGRAKVAVHSGAWFVGTCPSWLRP